MILIQPGAGLKRDGGGGSDTVTVTVATQIQKRVKLGVKKRLVVSMTGECTLLKTKEKY